MIVSNDVNYFLETKLSFDIFSRGQHSNEVIRQTHGYTRCCGETGAKYKTLPIQVLYRSHKSIGNQSCVFIEQGVVFKLSSEIYFAVESLSTLLHQGNNL
jgi:hypothetical protein